VVGLDEMRDDRARLAREFNSITMRGAFDWTRDEELALAESGYRFAAENEMRLLGGPLLTPTDPEGGYPGELESFSADQLSERLTARISDVVEAFRGRIKTWIVIRDPLSAPGDTPWFELSPRPRDDNAFQLRLGADFMRVALAAAQQADPEAELLLGQTIERFNGPKAQKFIELIRELVDEGAPLDGVGIAGHGNVRHWNSAALGKFLEQIAALGLKTEIIELDARIGVFGRSADPYQAQGEYFRQVVAACLQSEGCRGVTFRGYDDAHNGYDDVFPYRWQKPNDPLLFDSQENKKPAYEGVLAALTGAS
jgi:endo-1,4-beta-xylanase